MSPFLSYFGLTGRIAIMYYSRTNRNIPMTEQPVGVGPPCDGRNHCTVPDAIHWHCIACDLDVI